MSSKSATLDVAFMQEQRTYLLKLRSALLAAAQATEGEEAGIKRERDEGPGEQEDDAQKLALLEVDGRLVVRDLERLARVDRALEKLERGTYGLSDVSGRPIPRERLEAVPEATCTLDEERTLEGKGS